MAIFVPKGTGPEAEKKSEEDEIEEEYPVSISEAAAFLRELADSLEKGGMIEVGLAQKQVMLTPEEPITLEISFKEDAKKKKLEVELEIKEHLGAAGKEGGRPTVRSDRVSASSYRGGIVRGCAKSFRPE